MGKKRNPWRGLASYEDPANNDKQKYDFCGRDEETTQLVKLIDNNLFVTLYGRTGAGKTSLLKAGAFPVLRLHNYLPVYIRLTHGEKDKSYAEIIIKEIEEKREIIVKRINDAHLINTDGKSSTYLWDYFCQTMFFSQEGKEIYPVIVLDQFEEIFISQDSDEDNKAELLLSQINALISDDLVLLDNKNFSDETNYRFVASIREDNLYLLEDCIDEYSLSIFKDNRYRLRPMKVDQATNAVLIPGRNCIVEQDKEILTSLMVEEAKDKDGTISSLMLSFICSQLYEKAVSHSSEPQIDVKLFNEHQTESKRLLADFYLQHTSNKQRKIIEEYFITEDGHRKTSRVNIPHSKELIEKYNILQEAKTENGDELEIVHDRFAEVIYMHRRQRDSKKLRNVLCGIVGIILFALLGFAVHLSWSDSVNNNPSPIALKKVPKIYPATDTLLNWRGVYASLENKSNIKNIWIGDNVNFIYSLSVNDGQKIFVSPHNSKIKGDYIYRYTNFSADSVFFLYNVNNPQIAIYTQKKISYGDSLRFSNGLKSMEISGVTRYAAADSPSYGEETVEVKSDRELHFTKGDTRVKSLIFNNISEIPNYQYEGCISLEKVDFRVEEIELGYDCFKNCPNLREVILPKKLNNSSYGGEFSSCFNLKKVTLPDEVEKPENIAEMFRWCPNISEVSYSANSHFHKADDGIIYYDSIPVIFNMCKTKDWVSKDSAIRIIDAIVVKNGGQMNILPAHWQEDHFSTLSVDNRGKKNATGYIIYQNTPSSILNIPMKEVSKFTYANYNQALREIHTPVADPNTFEFLHPNMEDMSNVTLFVPYGCKDAYFDSGKYKDYKDIKEETFSKRVSQTIDYWWVGIRGTFGTLSWLLYPIVFGVLTLLLFVFYKLKVYQMSKHGFVSKRKALLYAAMADIAAVVGFIPAYYTVFWLAYNHYKLEGYQIGMLMIFVLILFAYFVIRLIIDSRKKVLWPWLLSALVLIGCLFVYLVMKWDNDYYGDQCICLGSFCGGLFGYICAYLAAFAGNGKILSKIRRWKIS